MCVDAALRAEAWRPSHLTPRRGKTSCLFWRFRGLQVASLALTWLRGTAYIYSPGPSVRQARHLGMLASSSGSQDDASFLVMMRDQLREQHALVAAQERALNRWLRRTENRLASLRLRLGLPEHEPGEQGALALRGTTEQRQEQRREPHGECTVRLRMQVRATQPCVHNVTFGCDREGMWVQDGCRGVFRCNGNPTGICGMRRTVARMHCSCFANVSLNDASNSKFRNRLREEVAETWLGQLQGALDARHEAQAATRATATHCQDNEANGTTGTGTANADAATAAAAPPRTSLPGLHWLHLPKSGTAFVATVVRYACPELLTRVYSSPEALPMYTGHGPHA
jgi:hypothetical protein